MTNEIEALKAELAAVREDLDNLRLEFPDALLEGDLATERTRVSARSWPAPTRKCTRPGAAACVRPGAE